MNNIDLDLIQRIDLILSTYDIRKKYLFKLGDTCLCHIKLSSGILHNQF